MGDNKNNANGDGWPFGVDNDYDDYDDDVNDDGRLWLWRGDEDNTVVVIMLSFYFISVRH